MLRVWLRLSTIPWKRELSNVLKDFGDLVGYFKMKDIECYGEVMDEKVKRIILIEGLIIASVEFFS